MSKNSYVIHLLLGFIIGLFILPSFLGWLGISFSFADLLELILGEPSPISRIIALVFLFVFLFFAIRSFYKQYKKLS